jgi:hypothetical protein
MTVKSLVLGTTIAVAVIACIYGCLAYGSLRSELRAMGVR